MSAVGGISGSLFASWISTAPERLSFPCPPTSTAPAELWESYFEGCIPPEDRARFALLERGLDAYGATKEDEYWNFDSSQLRDETYLSQAGEDQLIFKPGKEERGRQEPLVAKLALIFNISKFVLPSVPGSAISGASTSDGAIQLCYDKGSKKSTPEDLISEADFGDSALVAILFGDIDLDEMRFVNGHFLYYDMDGCMLPTNDGVEWGDNGIRAMYCELIVMDPKASQEISKKERIRLLEKVHSWKEKMPIVQAFAASNYGETYFDYTTEEPETIIKALEERIDRMISCLEEENPKLTLFDLIRCVFPHWRLIEEMGKIVAYATGDSFIDFLEEALKMMKGGELDPIKGVDFMTGRLLDEKVMTIQELGEFLLGKKVTECNILTEYFPHQCESHVKPFLNYYFSWLELCCLEDPKLEFPRFEELKWLHPLDELQLENVKLRFERLNSNIFQERKRRHEEDEEGPPRKKSRVY